MVLFPTFAGDSDRLVEIWRFFAIREEAGRSRGREGRDAAMTRFGVDMTIKGIDGQPEAARHEQRYGEPARPRHGERHIRMLDQSAGKVACPAAASEEKPTCEGAGSTGSSSLRRTS